MPWVVSGGGGEILGKKSLIKRLLSILACGVHGGEDLVSNENTGEKAFQFPIMMLLKEYNFEYFISYWCFLNFF